MEINHFDQYFAYDIIENILFASYLNVLMKTMMHAFIPIRSEAKYSRPKGSCDVAQLR